MRPTRENLRIFAAPPLTRWLINAAESRSLVTYGEAKLRLETDYNFSTIFSTEMGVPAGKLMNDILALYPDAPLLNVLLVQQGDRMPGNGAGSFLATRFKRPELAEKNARSKYPKVWRQTFDNAVHHVYSFMHWSEIYKNVYQTDYIEEPIIRQNNKGQSKSERDGLPRGRTGEGPNHRALRLWVKNNPGELFYKLGYVRSETEVDLLSGDRVDVVFYASDCTVVLEVKSSDSNLGDLTRGVYQCVKYRAVLTAMDAREKPNIITVLVTETELPGFLAELTKLLGITHLQAPLPHER